MKVIVTGATGLVGKALVHECINNKDITKIYVLSRRDIEDEVVSRSAKLAVILHQDFLSYPPELLEQVADAEACLWAIGGRVFQFPSVEACRVANVDSTLAAAKAFIDHLGPKLASEGKKLRFIFCSGMMTEWDQDKTLLFLNDSRKIKGQVEKGLVELQEQNKDVFQAWCVRPSGISPANVGLAKRAVGLLFSAIGVDQVARAMVRIAVDGYPEQIIENAKLKEIK